MGTISFSLPDDLPAAARSRLAHGLLVGGFDQTPVPTGRDLSPTRMTFRKDADESAYYQAVLEDGASGPVMFSTATLREREEPYHPLVELARGKLNQVRNQSYDWESIGLVVPADLRADVAELVRRFGAAATSPGPSAADCVDLLESTLRAGDRLAGTFSEQLLASRVAEKGLLPTTLGCRLTAPPSAEARGLYAKAFNAVRAVPDWSVIEARQADYDWSGLDELTDWARAAGMDVSVGPLVDLANGPFPTWFEQAAGDLPALAAYACDFVETVVSRYRGRVRTWQVFAGFNHADALGLDADDRLRLAARLVETTRLVDADADLTIGIAQPWGDYLASGPGYSPVAFADMLIRAGMTFAALELELLNGPAPRASSPRDLLDTFRVLDLFGGLGVPLDVTVGAPSDHADRTAGAVQLALSMPHVRSVMWEAWTSGPADRSDGPCGYTGHGELFRDRIHTLRDRFLI